MLAIETTDYEKNQQELQLPIMVAHDLELFVLSTIPIMIFFGMRHALDVDHITAIDNLVRMHNVSKRAKWVGKGFSLGHSTSIFLELVIII